MPRGVKRAGAGRKKNAPNRRRRELQERVEASGLAPLDYMLAVMRDEDAEPWRRDEMAKAAASYVHPRLAAIATGGDVNTNIAERLERALTRVDGPEQSGNDGRAAALGPAWPSDRRRRSPRARTERRRQSIARKVQKLAGLK